MEVATYAADAIHTLINFVLFDDIGMTISKFHLAKILLSFYYGAEHGLAAQFLKYLCAIYNSCKTDSDHFVNYI